MKSKSRSVVLMNASIGLLVTLTFLVLPTISSLVQVYAEVKQIVSDEDADSSAEGSWTKNFMEFQRLDTPTTASA